MSAVFAAPVAAVLLAVELLLFEWKPRSFIPVAVAAIMASVLRVPLLGAGPIFPVVAHAPVSGMELAAFAAGRPRESLAGSGSGCVEPRSSMPLKTSFKNSRCTGCGGRPSARYLWAWGESSIRACRRGL